MFIQICMKCVFKTTHVVGSDSCFPKYLNGLEQSLRSN